MQKKDSQFLYNWELIIPLKELQIAFDNLIIKICTLVLA